MDHGTRQPSPMLSLRADKWNWVECLVALPEMIAAVAIVGFRAASQ